MPVRGRGRMCRASPEPGSSGRGGYGPEEEGAVGGLPVMEEEASEPTLADLSNLLKAHIGQQKAMEAYWDKEASSSSEPEVATPVQRLSGNYSQASSPMPQLPKLQKLSEEDDIEHFLITFERIAAACRWPKVDWAFHLIPLLTGKARSAFVHMDVDVSMNYDQVKSAILQKYEINSETYRQRFRSLQVDPEETPKELYIRLKELYGKWVQPRELQVWIKEHDPESADEAATLANVFVAARGKHQPWAHKSGSKGDFGQPPPAPSVGKPFERGNFTSAPSSNFHGKKPICYLCGQEGHTKPRCPQNTVKLSQMGFVPREETQQVGAKHNLQERFVELNGRTLKALIDTGSTQTLVRRKYVPPYSICTSETVPICCVHVDEKEYPTTDVYLTVNGQTYLLNVGVADNLPFPVILWGDLPVLIDLLPHPQCNVVVTRAQSKQSEEIVSDLRALPFYNVEFSTERAKEHKSKRQKRREKFRGTAVTHTDTPELDVLQDFKIPGNILELQHQDPNLAQYFEEAKAKGNDFCVQNDILYRQNGSIKQLVVPRAVRGIVLRLGHAIPWAGHLGKHKTLARVKRYFYWPGLRKDVEQFCRSCPECQITSARRPHKAPLHPLPVVSTPFQRLGMDVVGPVEKSKSGNRFMLVITDYATKYPEVFPLKTIKAKTVAFCLLQLFSRVGFPQEILTDQGTNFMSKLLKDVYQLLGIKGLRTTAYHPQTDGLTERFNQTLKQMLRKFVNETGSDWDQWLPYILFAYREVPKASTGFSPFELLYGRDMREQLEKMTTLAREHMKTSQKQQKTWYDSAARERGFDPGQKVLVMLPSEDSKLLAKWQGPYEVKEKLGPTTYKVALPGRGRAVRVLHVNLLKEWVSKEERPVSLYIRSTEDEEREEQYLPVTLASEPGLDHLPVKQRLEVGKICSSEVFKETPGYTTVVMHDVALKNNAVPKRMSYRIPQKLLDPLKREVDLMLSLGIIEASYSEWCNPIVLVPKKDGTIRFCIDFRYLNSVSKFDSYPTPRIDELIERLGTAKYLTTIDLCKGYWQVPLSSRSRELTAFRTPWGLYHFRVMPFGLHGAPATFQRLMDKVLCGLSQFAAAYLDDIIIYSNSWDEHLQHLKVVLRCLQNAGLTVNPAKCAFAKRETEYLGFVIGGGLVKPQIGKVEAIRCCPLPRTQKQLKSFLGMSGWYHRFIPNYSARASLLTDMTSLRGSSVLRWSEEAVKAFRDIQQALCQDPVLHCPDFEQEFVLQTDACDRGLGAVLLQGPPNDRHPIAFISRKLFPRETRYSTIEKECLAIKWALDALRYYLLGRHFVLETDHRALKWLERMRDTNNRITRWYLAMQPYKFEVQYIPGKQNSTADYLSRGASELSEEGECVVATTSI
ncbi:uncharacterized protein LOC130916648 [Corythoichthys intestinalis]|uniref:uncharacterized protein LOC130916648 n=1 Tax=Corythoichthys intestinalis TaxID=161448 RepID=UPI0025A4F1B1|nr:uncharacterized protein LOC130916648 [Corythoichthys intestinalis]